MVVVVVVVVVAETRKGDKNELFSFILVLNIMKLRDHVLWGDYKICENNKAWLATYFELPHPQPRNPATPQPRNPAQLAFLVVATRKHKRNRNFIKFQL